MKKETAIAITLGIIFGVILATVMIFRIKEKETQKLRPITTTNKITPTVIAAKPVQAFEITGPQNKTIINTKSVVIKGKAPKESLIIIQSPIKETVIKNTKEDFSVDFPLSLGENIIKIIVYPQENKGRSQEKELRIYYLDEL